MYFLGIFSLTFTIPSANDIIAFLDGEISLLKDDIVEVEGLKEAEGVKDEDGMSVTALMLVLLLLLPCLASGNRLASLGSPRRRAGEWKPPGGWVVSSGFMSTTTEGGVFIVAIWLRLGLSKGFEEGAVPWAAPVPVSEVTVAGDATFALVVGDSSESREVVVEQSVFFWTCVLSWTWRRPKFARTSSCWYWFLFNRLHNNK